MQADRNRCQLSLAAIPMIVRHLPGDCLRGMARDQAGACWKHLPVMRDVWSDQVPFSMSNCSVVGVSEAIRPLVFPPIASTVSARPHAGSQAMHTVLQSLIGASAHAHQHECFDKHILGHVYRPKHSAARTSPIPRLGCVCLRGTCVPTHAEQCWRKSRHMLKLSLCQPCWSAISCDSSRMPARRYRQQSKRCSSHGGSSFTACSLQKAVTCHCVGTCRASASCGAGDASRACQSGHTCTHA